MSIEDGKPYTPSKAELERYVAARPRTRQEIGYWNNGKLTRGIFYTACLGKQTVGMPSAPGYIPDAGMYSLREYALDAAKAFQEKARELLAKGEFVE